MQRLHTTHLSEENGTPHASSCQPRAPFLVYTNAIPPGEREPPPQAVRRKLRVEPDAKEERRAKILSIGNDYDLLMTRHLVRESARYEVRSVSGDALPEDSVISVIDLAIICHSVNELCAAAVIASLRRAKPSIPILRLTTAFVRRQSIGREVIVPCAPDGPQMLLAQIHSILKEFPKSATGSQA
jgi:hypothetical protein